MGGGCTPGKRGPRESLLRPKHWEITSLLRGFRQDQPVPLPCLRVCACAPVGGERAPCARRLGPRGPCLPARGHRFPAAAFRLLLMKGDSGWFAYTLEQYQNLKEIGGAGEQGRGKKKEGNKRQGDNGGRPWHNEYQVYFISSKGRRLSSCWGHKGEAKDPHLSVGPDLPFARWLCLWARRQCPPSRKLGAQKAPSPQARAPTPACPRSTLGP